MNKLSKISLGLVAALGSLVSAPAFAVATTGDNTAYNAANAAIFYISGASAQDSGILGYARKVCTPGTLAAYTISNNQAFLCKSSLIAGKTQLAIHKYSVGGSGNGVGPVATGGSFPFLDLAKINTGATHCTTSTAAPFFTNTSLPAYTKYACSSSASITTSAQTKIGFSDLEPEFFTDRTTAAALTAESVTALVFGVPVTKKVRDKLQAYQSLTVGSETEANMPSLTTAQLSTIFTQAGQTWSGIGYPMNVAVGASADILADDIYVARRVNSSGTQKTFEALVAGSLNGDSSFKNCSIQNSTQSVNGFVQGGNDTIGEAFATACGTAITSTVFSGSGGGDVISCLNTHDAGNRAAVGLQTTEQGTASAGWRFVKIDGLAPSLYNTAIGGYRLYTENSINYLPATNTGSYATFITDLKAKLADPDVISTINGGYAVGGLFALASITGTATVPANAAAVAANPTLPWTRIVDSKLNNCAKGALFN